MFEAKTPPFIEYSLAPVALTVKIPVLVPQTKTSVLLTELMTGRGLTVAFTFVGSPGQPAAVPVTEYTAITGLVPLFTRVCCMDDNKPVALPEAPVIVPGLTVQVKVVPATGLFKLIWVVSLLQITAAFAETTGNGLTATFTIKGFPSHEFAEGMTL